jgi:hypothetical protein
VTLDFMLRGRIDFAVDEVREFANDVVAVQFSLPCLK